jgi:UDP-N-acetylmuramoyl-tripeptide--D-alanyl-D-alanine ligase
MAAAVVGQATPLWLVVTNLLLWPVEESLRRLYLHSAARRIRRVRPKIIAVTGSYGKTTTKEIIAHLLAARHRVLKTPQSYNTLMGVCKVIRGELRDDHEFFVVEMGAYRRGSIARLCMLTPPDISVITTIGIQHLERFGSPESVKLAKAEIIQALAPEGLAVLNGDNASCREVEGLTRGRIVRFGLTDREDLAYSATQMRFGPDGVAFTLNARGGESMRVQTRLLGRHNVMNVLAAVSVAHELGLSLEEISRSLLSLEPVPHRLQPIRGAGGVSIIDDAYNANPEGAISALETLAQFAGRKILVTPGLVELGERSTEENRKFGAAAASVCDLVFLVGPEQTKAIQEGLRERAFNPEKLKIFLSTADAVQHLSSVTRSGDVILFENDLPDQYNEASHFVGTGRNDAKA